MCKQTVKQTVDRKRSHYIGRGKFCCISLSLIFENAKQDISCEMSAGTTDVC